MATGWGLEELPALLEEVEPSFLGFTPAHLRDPMATDVFDVETDFTWANDSAFDTIQIRFPADLPLVPIDAQLIEQLFLNLLKNAGEALEETGGTVRVTAARSPEGRGVVVSVADDGPGAVARGSASRSASWRPASAGKRCWYSSARGFSPAPRR